MPQKVCVSDFNHVTYPVAKRLRQPCDEDSICPFLSRPIRRIHLHQQPRFEICPILQIISNQLLGHCTSDQKLEQDLDIFGNVAKTGRP